jgi:hypothetical protein
MTTIIGLCGFGGVGKDTVAQLLVENHHFTKRAFADKLREFALFLDSYLPEAQGKYSDLERCGGYEQAKRTHPCVRQYLVTIGEACRKTFSPTHWIDMCLARATLCHGDAIVISDVRYPNEVEAIHQAGGVIWRIHRPDCEAAHPTEAASIAKCKADFELNNDGTIEDLKEKVNYQVSKAKLSPYAM